MIDAYTELRLILGGIGCELHEAPGNSSFSYIGRFGAVATVRPDERPGFVVLDYLPCSDSPIKVDAASALRITLGIGA